jgi:hypothetical protein
MKDSVDQSDLNNPKGITGIYVNMSNRNLGLPVFRQKDQEYNEQPGSIELWQKNGDGKMHFIKSWRKRNISHIEFLDVPNTWVPSRHFFFT